MALAAGNPGGGATTTQTDQIYRTSIPSLTSFTEMMWVYLTADNNAVSMFSYRNDYDVDSEWIALGVNSTGTTLWVETAAGNSTGSTLSLNTWYHVALVKDGNDYTVYLNGVSDISRTDSTSLASINRWYLFGFHSSTSAVFGMNGRMAAYKLWNGVSMTQDMVKSEMRCYEPTYFLSLYSFLPFLQTSATDFNDRSAAGNNWTGYAGNSFSIAEGPPIPWNLSRRRWVGNVPAAPPAGGLVKIAGSPFSLAGGGGGLAG